MREQLVAISRMSPRTLLLGTVLALSAAAAGVGFVLAQYYSVDVLSSMVYIPDDCWVDWGIKAGRHCFSDYAWQMSAAMQPNPWNFGPAHWPPNPYPAAAMVPHFVFGLLGTLLGSPRFGLLAYLVALTVAVLTPAIWAARGARGLERIVVFLACGALAMPAWFAVDRGNSVGFVVPIALVFLIALRRERWGLVALMVVLAALVKPQFAALAFALFAARQWRLGGAAVGGVALSNLAAYLFWPRDFPGTIMQSLHNASGYGVFSERVAYGNVSFAKGVLLLPDAIKAQTMGGRIPDGFLAGPRNYIGYAVLIIVVLAVLLLGRRISPVMVGILLLPAASLWPAVTFRYYLVFALPIAALVARDPNGPPGSGIFDSLRERRRAVGLCVSLATALSIAYIVAPGAPIPILAPIHPGTFDSARTVTVSATTVMLTPILWLIVCAVILASYARRPDTGALAEDPSTGAPAEKPALGAEAMATNAFQ